MRGNAEYAIFEKDQIPDPTPTPILDENLVGYWKFDGDALDSSGNSNHGILENGSTCTSEGYFNGALELDGVDDYVSINTSPELTFSSDDQFTISLWFNLSSESEGPYDTLISSSPDSEYHYDYIYLDIQDSNARVHMEGDSSIENVAI
ncbi:MAG: hypothetical protein GY845_33990, partial [Planctomycetes bacterium]|nr:hypothetical protein [Planctomycetota bacterium]